MTEWEIEKELLPRDWQLLKIDDIKSSEPRAIITGPFGSNIGSRFFVGSGVPVIRGNNLSLDMTRFIDDGFVFVTPEKADELNTWAKRDDIVLTAAGTLGQVGIIEECSKYSNYVISNKQMRLRVNKNIVRPLFAFYWLSTPRIVKYIRQLNTGSTIPLINLSVLRNLPIVVPPLVEQDAIVELLDSIDSKIKVNHLTNALLEEIGQAIFKRWFVDFEFPNEESRPYKSSSGEMVHNEVLDEDIPKGWDIKPIDEIADFLNGLALQKFPARAGEGYLPVIKIRELRQGITESSDRANLDLPEEYIVNDGDVLFSWSGSLEVIIWGFGKGALNQHLFKVTSSKYPKWFFYYWIVHYLPEYRQIAADKATTMGHIQRHHLTASQVAVPDEKTFEKMDRLFAPILERIGRIKVETRILSEIRDLTLPKLMSGKIRVPVKNESAEVQ